MSKKIWHSTFGPSYTPEQMLRMGVFEGKFINVLKGLPKSWYDLPKVLGPKDDPDPSLNYYRVKSRQPLSVWKENGWLTKDSPWGWFGWYCLYYTGRRLEKEDDWQIGRWRSFVARHQGQIKTNCSLDDKSCRPKQRQGLLQWAWNSSTEFTDENIARNAKRMARNTKVSLEGVDALSPSEHW